MNTNIIKVLFLAAKNRPNKMGKCTIKCRITYLKTRMEFSTGLSINPKDWNSKQQYVEPPEPDSDYINNQLSLIKTKINRTFLMFQVQEKGFAVQDIYKTYKGEKLEKQYNAIEFYERYLKRLKALIGIDIKQVT